jgi:hypothetical protein
MTNVKCQSDRTCYYAPLVVILNLNTIFSEDNASYPDICNLTFET